MHIPEPNSFFNSGNRSLISNQEIKDKLLELEKIYKVTKDEEEHFRLDSEELLFKPYFEKINSYPLVENFKYQISAGQIGQNIEIPITEINKMLNDLKQQGYLLKTRVGIFGKCQIPSYFLGQSVVLRYVPTVQDSCKCQIAVG